MFRIECISQRFLSAARRAWEHSAVALTREKHQALCALWPRISFCTWSFQAQFPLIPVKVTGIAAMQMSLLPSGIKNILSVCSRGRLLLCLCSPRWSWVGFVCPGADHQSPAVRGSDTPCIALQVWLKKALSEPGRRLSTASAALCMQWLLSSLLGNESFPCTVQRCPISLEMVQFCRVPRNPQ